MDAKQIAIEQARAEKELNDIVDELWFWYENEVARSLRGLIGSMGTDSKDGTEWLCAFIIDASTAIAISSARWTVLVRAVHFRRLMDPGLEGPKADSRTAGGGLPLHALLPKILSQITDQPSSDNAYARSVAAIKIQCHLMCALGQATIEYVSSPK